MKPPKKSKAKSKSLSNIFTAKPQTKTVQKLLTIRIEYHSFQQEVFYHHARFKVLFAGRRWGKTRGAINWLTLGAVSKKCLCWWVSPTYRQAKIAYRYFRK